MYMNMYVCVNTHMSLRIPIRVHKIHPVGCYANESPRRRLNAFSGGGDGMDEWFKALTSCEAIGAVPGSNLQIVHFIY